MPMPATAQSTFFDPTFVCPDVVQRGSLVWLLAERPGLVLPAALQRAWERPGLPGRDPWPLQVVAAATLLRFAEEGMSRRGAAKRLKTDGSWRAAAGLSWNDSTPDESELRRFERFLASRDEAAGARWVFLWMAHVVDACRQHGVLGGAQTWVADSTPMLCYGAILDTVRFLGDEARSLAAYWAKLVGCSPGQLARAWDLPMLAAKSTKGFFRDTDWADLGERAEAVNVVAETALAVAARIRRSLGDVASQGKRKRLARRCRNIVRKVEGDLETDDKGRLVVARRVVENRLVSRTDPEARHARKSKSKRFNGFKLHVLGDAVSGLIAAVCVTPANTHDGAVAHRLIARAKALCDDLDQVLGDTHYGGARLRLLVRETLDVDLLGKPQALPTRKDEHFRKEDFDFDLDAMTATCPAGVITRDWVWNKASDYPIPGRRFRWPKGTCQACPLRNRCLGKGKMHRDVRANPYEQELSKQRQRWSEHEVRERYRDRSTGERLINTMTRHGCRRARAWGLQAAQVQAHVVAIASNLKLLAAAIAQRDDGG